MIRNEVEHRSQLSCSCLADQVFERSPRPQLLADLAEVLRAVLVIGRGLVQRIQVERAREGRGPAYPTEVACGAARTARASPPASPPRVNRTGLRVFMAASSLQKAADATNAAFALRRRPPQDGLQYTIHVLGLLRAAYDHAVSAWELTSDRRFVVEVVEQNEGWCDLR
jgi:hypothetical protein